MKKSTSSFGWTKHLAFSALALLITMPITAEAKTSSSCQTAGQLCGGSGNCPDCCCADLTCIAYECTPGDNGHGNDRVASPKAERNARTNERHLDNLGHHKNKNRVGGTSGKALKPSA